MIWTGWDDAAQAALRRMWCEEGRSASQIAAVLGCTRNAVIGRVHRCGLNRNRMAGAEPKPAPARKAPRQPRPSPPEAPPQPPAPETPPAAILEENPAPPIRGADPTPSREGPHPTLLELRPGDCRFPRGGPRERAVFFCGEPRVAPQPYCLAHCQQAFQLPAPFRKGGMPNNKRPPKAAHP